MELKDIEDFFKKVENLYIIGLFFAAVILLYITVIGVSVVFMVTDKAYSEEVETDNVTKTMQDIIDRNNIIMYVLIGFLGFMALVISYLVYSKSKESRERGEIQNINMSDIFKALTNVKYIFSLVLLIIVMVAINSLCKYIQDIKSLNVLYNIGVGIVSSVSVIVVILGIVMYKRFIDKNRKVYPLDRFLAPVA